MSHRKRFSALCFIAVLLVFASSSIMADPCLVVYPGGPCVYRYDVSEYYTVGPGEPYYDAEYDRGGKVLLEIGSNEIDGSIYQAPMLAGFEESIDGNEGYIFVGTDFELIVDGFSNDPTTFVNVLVVFDKVVPAGCPPTIYVDGSLLGGMVFNMGDLAVSTPTPNGRNYSDTMSFDVNWRGCYGVHIWAFSDENYNGVMDGGECFTAYSHDMVVPTESSSWGEIKTISK